MGIRAKMKCMAVNKQEESETVQLTPVTATNEENKSWSKWTPSGMLSLTITNPDVFDKFAPGREYFVDVTPIDGGT